MCKVDIFWWCYFHLWFTAPRTDSELKWPTNLHVWHHFCFFFNNKALKKWPLAEVRLVVLCKNNTKQKQCFCPVCGSQAHLFLLKWAITQFICIIQTIWRCICFACCCLHKRRCPCRLPAQQDPFTARTYKAEYQHTYSLSHSESTESFLIKWEQCNK